MSGGNIDVVAYSVAIKKNNAKKCEKAQRKCESSFCIKLSSVASFLMVVSVILGIVYVAQINRLAIMGYEIKEKENLIVELKRDNESLKINAAELKSMHQLELKRDEMNLKKPQDVGYLELDDSVAMKR